MAEFTATAEQTVLQNQPVIFTNTSVPCNRGFVRHEDGTGVFTLSGWLPNGYSNSCCCCQNDTADYLVEFHGNIAVPEDGTAGEISLALQIGGSTIPASTMTVTPTAVSAFFNVGTAKNVEVWDGCCQNVSVVNISDQSILVRNAVINFSRPDLVMSM